MFDAGLPALAYLDAQVPSDAHRRIRDTRQQAPIALGPFGPELLSYHLVCDALRDPRFRRPSRPGLYGEHERAFRALSTILSPRVAERLAIDVVGVITELLHPLTTKGSCDVVADVTQRFAVPVVCAALGVPRDDWAQFARWADESANPRTWHELYSYVDVMIGARCWKSSDDLLMDLILTDVDGRELSTDELIGLVAAVLTVGADLAGNQLAASVAALSDHPDQWVLLADRPELAGNAVEETMRYAPVRFGEIRVATEDVELAGVWIPAGTTVHVNIAAANRDPQIYDQPDRLDITRSGPPAARSFSAGASAPLAKIVVGEALSVLARRMPHIRRTADVTWRPMVGTSGPAALPVEFDAGH